jgi:archaemetzincin
VTSAPILIVPAGPLNDPALIHDLAAALTRALGARCAVASWSLHPAFAWNRDRGQYYSTALLEQLAREAGSGARILGVTGFDLFVPVLTFVFGEAQVGGSAAVISSFRLREEMYGLTADAELLLERLTKEAVHEIGHTFGLRHCDDWTCAMASSNAVERLDIRTASFCERCRGVLG